MQKTKLEYFGHIMRNTKYGFLEVIIQGKIEGKKVQSVEETRGLQIYELF